MKPAISIALFVIVTGLLFSCGKQPTEPVQYTYIQQMLGTRTWTGTEKDTVVPGYAYASSSDTAYSVTLQLTITFVNDTTLYVYADTGNTNNHFQENNFVYLTLDTVAKKMLFYNLFNSYGPPYYDTLAYNYTTNTMSLTQNYFNSEETYLLNIHTP